ncbi:hypothetical protein [Deinococcus sp. UYEF24]
MNKENVVGDARRVYQAVHQYAEKLLWNDSRNTDTIAWLVTRLLQSQKSTLPEWITHRQSEAQFVQSRERQARRWLGNAKVEALHFHWNMAMTAVSAARLSQLSDQRASPLVFSR